MPVAERGWGDLSPPPDDAPFLALLDADDADALRQLGHRRRCARGSSVFREGDRSTHVVLVVSGLMKIWCAGADGRETVLALRGPGHLLGELAAVDGAPRSASASALVPTDLRLVAAEDFEAYLADHPRAAMALLRTVVGRLRDSDLQRLEFGASDVTARLSRRLLELADHHGRVDVDGHITLDLPLTQEELAGMVGASREAVTRSLRALRQRGMLVTQRRRITLLDLEALRRSTR